MKKYLVYMMCAAAAVIGGTSCSDFGDVNVDPEHLNEGNIPAELLFTSGQHQMLGSDWDVWRNGCIYSGQWMHQIASPGNWSSQAKYHWQDDYSSAYWGIYSGDNRGALRDMKDAIEAWQDDPQHQTDYQIARIMFAYGMHRMTDLYGDIPYSQAVQPDLYSYPAYDTQESIYMDLLKELNEAQAALNGAPTATMSSADNFYQGDPAKWRKFANSLMLRVAMRMSKVDPAAAQQWAQTAVANGVFESNDDNCMLMHAGGSVADDSSEPYAKIFAEADAGNFFLNSFFVDMLKETNDPRLAMIATVCEDPQIKYSAGSDFQYGNSDPAIQQGLPDGVSDSENSPWYIGKYYPEYIDESAGEFSAYYRSRYSTVNRYTYSDPTGPTFVCTYAQTQLLMAEAAYRGWISGNAQTYYENGVRAAMQQFTQFPNATALYNQYMTSAAIDQYLTENPYDAANALEQINTQYYINCFCDGYEVFANWRRSGYPELTPTYFADQPLGTSDTDGTIPRRFRYPTAESQDNAANYEAAVSRMAGGDHFDSRMWWDVE